MKSTFYASCSNHGTLTAPNRSAPTSLGTVRRLLTSAAVWIALARMVIAAPDTWDQSVSYQGETVTMRLMRQDLRGDHFELWSQNASGGYDIVAPTGERSYMGTVDGYPGAVSCGILLDSGEFKGAIYFDRGATWFTQGSSVTGTRGLEYATFDDFQYPSAPTVGPGQAGTFMHAFDLGIDVDYDYFTRAGSSMATALEGIEYSACVVRAIYMRDVLLRPYLGRVIVRSTLTHDPYTGLSQGDYLAAMRDEWNTHHTDADFDLVSGASPTKIGGGLAWVSVVGKGNGYSVNQSNSSGNFDVVFRHEMGHNWGCGHYVGGSPEGKGIMGGNQPGRFSGCEAYRIFNHRDDRVAAGGILEDQGVYTDVTLPPYAAMDAERITQTVSPSVTVAVLDNDHDANGQAVRLATHDAVSANGGAVARQGQYLVYTAPGSFLGSDHFTYSIADTEDRLATGVAVVSVEPNDPLRMYLPLDETEGTTVADHSAFDNPASLSGTTFPEATVAGTHGNAVQFDGSDDAVSVSGVKFDANTATFTAWIKQGATQNDWAGIIFDRSFSASGLNIGENRELRYHWNGSRWGWNSGLTPPADTWTFVALVVEPSRATIYMNAGSGFQSAVNVSTHVAAPLSSTYVGRDPGHSSRHFDGAIDDARIYDYAMSPSDLLKVMEGGGAVNPTPFDGAFDVTSNILRWTPGAAATTQDVYIGTNMAAVAQATRTSPEYQGTAPSSEFVATLADQTPYYWRIDTVTTSSTLTGPVWSFATGRMPAPGDAILVNFARSSSEAFAGGQLIGPLGTDSTYWNEGTGAAGSLANLIDDVGTTTGVDVQWTSATTWGNSDGTADDEHKLSTGYLDDGDGSNGDGKGVIVSLSDIPYPMYRVHGLFATDQNSGGSCRVVNFSVNGTWALGGRSTTTATAWGSIESNRAAHGAYWTEIIPGTTQGNCWTVVATGATCNITGELRSGSSRGCLTAVIIEALPDTDGDGIPDDLDPDDDNDGIPDDWEIAHDLDPLVDDRADDPDVDRFDNGYEYIADTHPRDRDSRQTFSVERSPSTDTPIVRFRTSADRRYAVEYREGLNSDSWDDLDPAFPGTGSEMTVPVPSDAPGRHHRLRIELPSAAGD